MNKFAIPLVALFAVALAHAQQGASRQERGNLVLEGIPARDAVLTERIGRYSSSRRAEFLDWLPEGGMLVSTRFADADQVHRVTVPLAMREQLTFYPDPVNEARVPQIVNAEGFLFLKGQGKSENPQIYLYRNTDRSARLLTDGKASHGSPLWSHDGKRFAFYGNSRDGVGYDIYVLEIGTNNAPRLVAGAQKDKWVPLDWSPDDQKLLVRRDASGNESYLFVVDAWSGIMTPLGNNERKIGITVAKFSPDGRGVIAASDEDSEFAQLRYIDLTTHESRKLVTDRNWDVTSFETSSDGRYLAYVRNEDGRSRLSVVDNQTKLELAPPNVPEGRLDGLRFDRTGKRLAFSAESAQSPRDVYVYDLSRNAVERWTQSEAGPVDASRFATPELVHYPTFDRRMISAYVYRPSTPGPHPVLIYTHSRCDGQYTPGFEPFFQFLAQELGIAVIAPNVRGSTGYGGTFLKLGADMAREDAVKDIGSLIVWIGLQPAFDRERVFAMGGRVALASLATYNDRLRGVVNIADDSRSLPFTQLAAMRRPLLVVNGLADAQVSSAQSQQMVAVLRARGNEVWYLAAKDESRGFRSKADRDFCYETVAQFLERLSKR
jgi:dipeptidyl aminopeptidase/acylaminoacyl peptidase